jgi:hypothetical protein
MSNSPYLWIHYCNHHKSQNSLWDLKLSQEKWWGFTPSGSCCVNMWAVSDIWKQCDVSIFGGLNWPLKIKVKWSMTMKMKALQSLNHRNHSHSDSVTNQETQIHTIPCYAVFCNIHVVCCMPGCCFTKWETYMSTLLLGNIRFSVNFGIDLETANTHDRAVFTADCNIVHERAVLTADCNIML